MKSKRFILLLIFMLLLKLTFGFAQPKISYIIPDIGTPGLGIYVEIIGPYDQFGNSGTDSFYSSNSGNVRIVFDRPEDTNKIIVGPIYVSWQGRMLSTYFFVNPNLEEPNSSDWTLLDSKFKIPFRVEVNGVQSNTDTFYIVKPYSFGNLLQSNQVIGTGALGRRSRSGSILVDNLNLSNLDYKAFLDNSLNFPQANRTYLPLVVLATGNITGQGSNSRLNVNAGEGRLQNAGPGGGGGGGKFCDNISGNPGEDGGNGFTSGGKGGVNYFLSGNGAYKNLGCGTGDSGRSVNGVPPASNPGGWEASGGGTGHPFGKSGVGSGDQSNWNVPGGYGGGTGSINNRMGGSGGYATDGQSEPSNYVNGGKTHGNPMIVPLAGGSGGASGNPSGLNVCSGSGGGGGGAIRIFAKRIENLSVSANGANGGQSSNGAGGGGSGGAISICAKEVARDLNLSAQGGNGGGRGYFRVDAPSISNITYSHNNPPPYFGISTDTHSFVKRKFTLTGSKNPSSDNILIYIKSALTDWTLLKTVSGFANQSNWNTEIILPDTSKIFYLCAIQDLGSEVVDTFRYQLRYLYSQSAMNVLHRIPQGICSGTQSVKLDVYDCPSRVYIDSGVIKNVGDGKLNVYFSRARFQQNIGIELISPLNDVELEPNDSIKFYVRYVASGNSTAGVIFDSLFVEHSDDEWSRNPWGVQIRIELFPYQFEFYDISSFTSIDTIDFGISCDIRKYDTTIIVRNQSVFPIEFAYKTYHSLVHFVSSNRLIGSFGNDTLLITVDSIEGGIFDSIFVYPKDCPELVKKIYLLLFVIDTETNFIYDNKKTDTLHLGDICVGDSLEINYLVKNFGNYPLKIVNVNVSTPFNLKFYIPIDVPFEPLKTLDNKIILKPTQEGKFLTSLEYYFDQCQHKDTLFVEYNAVKSNAIAISGTYFGFVQIGESDTSIIVIVNKGSGTSYFDSTPPSFTNFKFLGSVPDLPTYLRPNDTLKLMYEFTPTSEGEFKEFVEYVSNSTNDCPDTIRFELRGFGTNAKIFANVDSVYFGLFPYCKSKDTVIYISNKGSTDLLIRKVEIVQSYNPEHFILSNSISNSTIPPNSIDSCVVKFVGVKGAPQGLKTAELIIESNDVNNPQIRIKLSAIQENLNVDLIPDTLDFGICQIGDFKTQTLILVNNGVYPEPQRIRDFEGNRNVFQPNPTTAIINPSDSVEIVFTFRPDREGEIFDSMRIVYFQPCPDTQWVYLRGFGTSGNFSVTDTLDFGDIVFCTSDTLGFKIVNLGTIPFPIDSAVIFGANASNFSLLTKFPIVVDSVNSVVVVFSGANSEEQYRAILRLYVFINNVTKPVDILLLAKPKRFINFEISEIDFGFVPIGSSKDSIIKIRNYGQDCLLSVNFFASRQMVFSSDLQKNLFLARNFEPNMKITFSPNREGVFEDTFYVVVQYPDCVDTIKLLLKGVGVPPQDVIIRVDDVLLDPKNSNGRIPMYIRIKDTTMVLKSFGLEFKISYYWAIFHTLGVDGGRIISDRIVNNQREITLRFDSLRIFGTEQKFAELFGVPLICDTDYTEIAIYDCVWGNPAMVRTTTLDFGSISTIVCTEGGKRLVKPAGTMLVDLSYKEEKLLVRINSLIKDQYHIKVYNTLGALLYYWDFDSDVGQHLANIPEEFLNSGVLLIQISNSFETKVLKTIIY
ncbi:hypothetical protein D9V84_10575 [Bacteroidetes/Chlorobi group bacterium Naka2016]|nr:MAG: hypothetical protein D9V84_10575 [Bacteroidetes/Chlorobi group bacterium Naka2016]